MLLNETTIATIETGLLALIITATIIFGIYQLAKKLSHDHIEYQYRYNEYQKAKEEINEIGADLRKHEEFQEASKPETKPFTQADFERWKAAKEEMKGQGGFVDLDELEKLFRRKTA